MAFPFSRYDPLSFLGEYKQLPEGAVLDPLQGIITGYLTPEQWYSRIRSMEDIRATPKEDLLFYLNDLISSGYADQVDALMDLYWSELPPFPEEGEEGEPEILRPKQMFIGAARRGYLPLVQYLSFIVGNYPPPLAIIQAAFYGHRDVVDYLLSIGASLNMVLIGGAWGNRIDIVDYALRMGANARDHAMARAIMANHPEMVSYLLDNVPININSALSLAESMSARGENRSEIIALLRRFAEGVPAVVV